MLLVERVSTPTAADIPEVLGLVTAVGCIVTVLNMPFRPPGQSREGISRPFEKPDPQLRSPEDDLTPWQWMTVSWLKPLLKVGKERQLGEDDVWFLGLEFHHRRLHDTFRELRGSVIRRLLQANGFDLIITTSLGVLEALASKRVFVRTQ